MEKEKTIDRETARYLAQEATANLLRETYIKEFDAKQDKIVHSNALFDKEELKTVKRAFLKLCGEI